MKKTYIYFMCLMLLFSTNSTAKAFSYLDYTVVEIPSQNVTIKNLSINNKVNSNITNFQEGTVLKDYYIFGFVDYAGLDWATPFDWENPDYIIKEGYQEAVISFVFSDVVKFKIGFTGVVNPEKETTNNTEKLKVFGEYNPDSKYIGKIGDTLYDLIPIVPFSPMESSSDSKSLEGELTFEGGDNLEVGINKIKWTFTPKDSDKYETKTGYFNVEIKSDNSKADIMAQATSSPSLTATSLLLVEDTNYTLSVNDKPEEATYTWTSSNPKIATVSSKGLVKSIKSGKTTITCKVKSSEGDYSLTSNIVVGLNEDTPILNEIDLELSIGDKFDIDVEGKIAKSKYRYVSSNKSIATVNATNGVVTAKKEGNVVVRCLVTLPSGKVIVLKSNINITK